MEPKTTTGSMEERDAKGKSISCLDFLINVINQERHTKLLRKEEKCSFSVNDDFYALSKHLTKWQH